MAEQNTQKQTIINADGNTELFQYLDLLFSQLPNHVNDWLFSEEATQNIIALAIKFNLNKDQTEQLARIAGFTVLKDSPMTDLAPTLKEILNVGDLQAKQISLAVAQTLFLPIRDHMRGVEDYIRQLGGQIPATLPPLKKPVNAGTETSSPMPQIVIVQKTLRQLVKDNKDALNQNLTNAPIKITDFDQPVRPTIKNWLVDYVKQKGAGHHEAMDRSDYLFNSFNSRPLPEQDRALLAEILRAYDDEISLPVDEETKAILLDKLTSSAPSVPALPRSGSVTPSAPSAAVMSPAAPAQNTSYREPISETDLSGPLGKPAPARPAPRLNGNIIDLSEISDK